MIILVSLQTLSVPEESVARGKFSAHTLPFILTHEGGLPGAIFWVIAPRDML